VRLDPEQAGHDRQSLAGALRDLRRAAGLSGERLARRCHMSQSKISRIENGRLLPSVVDVGRVLRALGVDQATSAELLALARVANAEYQDVRASVRRGLHHRQRELAALEADAREMRHFLPALITGLLQTPEYMRAAMDTPVEPTAGDTATAIALKLERQAILHDKSKRFEFLLTESALLWQLCEPSVMAVQLDRLISLPCPGRLLRRSRIVERRGQRLHLRNSRSLSRCRIRQDAPDNHVAGPSRLGGDATTAAWVYA
jgi:transcriptional regulator with XRE-family HTH domain